MGKHLTKTGIAGYGLLLAAASISVWSFSYARFTAQENGMAAVRGGRLPHSVSAIHTYTLAVSWPEDKAGTEYTDEIDLVTLTVSSEQTVPAIQE